ncbi:hypothetical protein EBN88_25485 [Streptomyces triticirhizae]|uniref:Uncharacterized protein n=1 Tax=Streptomyces triticirhizae TaxID=2483353 RepID=A0A3M2L2S7_9ACTN|nr:hypothetical protein EBN88_25485 [Streptomyces triticirhizae]
MASPRADWADARSACAEIRSIQRAISHPLCGLKFGPIGVQRVGAQGVAVLQLCQIVRHAFELPAKRVRRKPRPVQHRALGGEATDLPQCLADIIGELL